jgi:hypothetical protein
VSKLLRGSPKKEVVTGKADLRQIFPLFELGRGGQLFSAHHKLLKKAQKQITL